MASTNVRRSAVLLLCGITGLLIQAGMARAAEDDPAPPQTEAEKRLAEAREKLMASRVGQFRVSWSNGSEDLPKNFEPQPIFRYTDPARGYVAAAVWPLGKTGRPLAIVTTELMPKFYGRPRIVYEYLSLTAEPFSVTAPDSGWSPKASAVEFRPIPGSPVPATNERLRLIQIRNEAKRFTGYEIVGKERCELRLLPQPIHRYQPATDPQSDGAVFILAFGTNPEAILFMETAADHWDFAVGRLNGASKAEVLVDDESVWQIGPASYGWAESYTASNAPADIPGIAADGSAIPLE